MMKDRGLFNFIGYKLRIGELNHITIEVAQLCLVFRDTKLIELGAQYPN